MTPRIVFLPEAETELAVDWYEARGMGLGAEFLRSLDAARSHVQRHPALYPTVFGQARRAVLRRLPYSLISVVHESDLVIAACRHGSRDPRCWQQQLE